LTVDLHELPGNQTQITSHLWMNSQTSHQH